MPDSHTPADKAKEKKAAEPALRNAGLYDLLQGLVIALTVLLLIFTFFGRVIAVDGTSMVPTLNDRDMLFIQNVTRHPEPGDIVVLHKDFADITSPIVKRVIAVGGQTVEVNYNTSTVYVDGQPIDEPYINEVMYPMSGPYSQNTYWEVPEGSVFVMGDNRNHSSDSRDDRLGIIDERYIIGRAVCRLLPIGQFGAVD